MLFGQYSVPTPERKPTFLQFLKTTKLSKGVEGNTKFEVELIWLPGKFDNVTLSTHAFRYIADNEHPLYKDVLEWFEEIKVAMKSDENGVCTAPMMYLVIESLSDKTIGVHTHPKTVRIVSAVGENGVRFSAP